MQGINRESQDEEIGIEAVASQDSGRVSVVNDDPSDEDHEALQKVLHEVPAEILLETLIDKAEDDPDSPFSRVVARGFAISQQYSGPIPPPPMLEQYNKIHPGLAMELVEMAKKEQDHRHTLESVAVKGEIGNDKRGQDYALAICLAVLAVGVLAICVGSPVVGGLLSGGPLIGLAAVFINGKNNNKSSGDDTEKEKKPTTNPDG